MQGSVVAILPIVAMVRHVPIALAVTIDLVVRNSLVVPGRARAVLGRLLRSSSKEAACSASPKLRPLQIELAVNFPCSSSVSGDLRDRFCAELSDRRVCGTRRSTYSPRR